MILNDIPQCRNEVQLRTLLTKMTKVEFGWQSRLKYFVKVMYTIR